MFWDIKDPPSHNIEVLLESPDTKVEVFLDEDNIIQECKTFKKNIVNYFTRPDVLRRLIELITTEPPEELPIAERFRHANVACEILTMGLPSLDEKLLADAVTLKMLYSYLENEPPLNPLLASFFSKTFSMLFTKKSDQDWFLYQQTCLKLLEYLKTQNNFLDLICKHFTTPIVPDLIMEMMSNVEGGQLKRSLYDWLNEERLVEKLIDIIGDPEQSEKHANVADFLCDLIHQGRTMRQTDQDTDSFEPAFEGSNPILKNIESATTLFALFNVILQPNAIESAIVSGIAVVLKIIKPVKVTDERNTDRLLFLQEREKEIHDELLSTVIRVIEPQLKHFNELLRNPPKKADIITSAANLSPPFGMTRLQICRLFTVLLQTNNEEIAKAICETDFLDTLLTLFKEYCWNNFLHSEVEKCLQTVFSNSFENNMNINNNSTQEMLNTPDNNLNKVNTNETRNTENKENVEEKKNENEQPIVGSSETAEHLNASGDSKESDIANVLSSTPSAIQTHVIVNCKIVSKLIECWKANRDLESAEKGRRLGYMGHLINIFKHITNCISESEHIGALIESNLKDDVELELWKSIVNTTDGDLTQALNTQSKLLANYEPCDYNVSLDFFTDNNISDAFNGLCTLMDSSDAFGRNNDDDEGDEDESSGTAAGDGENGLSFYVLPHVNPFIETNDPWGNTNDDLDIFKTMTSTDNTSFADFESYFFSQPTATINETVTESDTNSKPTEQSTSKTSETTEATTSSEEYDNNANVEKSSWSENFTSFQVPKKDTQYTSNFVDDYEDDEGMWTKPLGSCALTATVEQSKSVEPINQTDESNASATLTSITNGPRMLEVNEHKDGNEQTSKKQLNNSLEDNPLIGEAAEDIALDESRADQAKGIKNDFLQEESTPKHKLHTLDINDEIGINLTTNQQSSVIVTAVDEVLDSSTTTTT